MNASMQFGLIFMCEKHSFLLSIQVQYVNFENALK
jgi:hypothetical protein